MCFFQEEIFGLVIGVIIFKDEVEVLVIVNEIQFGFGVGVWMWDINFVYCMGCGIKVGCVWINCYYVYLVYVVFGGYKQFGVGWEMYKMVLDVYQ